MYNHQGLVKTVIFVVLLSWFHSVFANLKKAKSLLKKGSYRSSANVFYQEYLKSSDEKEKAIIEYGLGKSLLALDLNTSAAYYFGEVIRRGSDKNIYFAKSFKNFYSIYKIIGLDPKFIYSVFGGETIDPSLIPQKQRSFYYYYKGKSLFEDKKFKKALRMFELIPKKNILYSKAVFFSAVIEVVFGNNRQAIKKFKKSIVNSRRLLNYKWIKEQAYLNIARVYYSEAKYNKAIKYYSKIPRDSNNWLEALFEASWAFSIMENPNNTLGNLHTILSPFYQNRFYPEAHILRAITLFQMCYYDKVKSLLSSFDKKYKSLYYEVIKLVKVSKRKKGEIFKRTKKYKLSSKKYSKLNQIFDRLSKTDIYRKAYSTLKYNRIEKRDIKGLFKRAKYKKLQQSLLSYLKKKNKDLILFTNNQLLAVVEDTHKYISNLFEQSILISAETLLKDIARLKKKLAIKDEKEDQIFIGGMQKLVVGQSLEYWPFEGEYWEDELGGYVYNIPNICEK